MRIVKLSSLSEKERKKVLEEQEERYIKNQQERQIIQKQANEDFVKRFGKNNTNQNQVNTQTNSFNKNTASRLIPVNNNPLTKINEDRKNVFGGLNSRNTLSTWNKIQNYTQNGYVEDTATKNQQITNNNSSQVNNIATTKTKSTASKLNKNEISKSVQNLLNDIHYKTLTDWTSDKMKAYTVQRKQQIDYVQNLVNQGVYTSEVGNLVLQYLKDNSITYAPNINIENIQQEKVDAFNKNVNNWIKQNVNVKNKKNTNNQNADVQNFNSLAESMKPKVAEQQEQTGLFKASQAYKDDKNLWDNIVSTVQTIGATTKDVGLNFVKGLGSIAEGVGDFALYRVAQVQDWMGDKEGAKNNRNYAKRDSISNWMQPAIDKVDKKSVIGDFGDTATQGMGYMAGLWAGSGIGEKIGGAVGGTAKAVKTGAKIGEDLTLVSSAWGNGMTEAYKKGATDKQAWFAGATSAFVERTSERLFGYFGNADTKIVNKLVNKVQEPLGKVLTRIIASGVGESAEEVVSYLGNYASNKIIQNTVDKDKNIDLAGDWDWNEILEEAGSAFLTATMMGGGQTAIGINDAKQNGITTKQAINQYATNLDIQGVQEEVEELQSKLEKETDSEKRNKMKQELKWKQQQLMSIENKDNKDINQETKTSQNQTSQASDATEVLRQEARNKLESIKQNYDENSYNQMQEFIETAPSEKALNQVIEDLNKESEQTNQNTKANNTFANNQEILYNSSNESESDINGQRENNGIYETENQSGMDGIQKEYTTSNRGIKEIQREYKKNITNARKEIIGYAKDKLTNSLPISNTKSTEYLRSIIDNDSITTENIKDFLSQNNTFKSKTIDEEIKKIRKEISSTKFKISDGVKSELKYTYGNLPRNINYSSDGIDIDSFYKELSSLYPDYFSEAIKNEQDEAIEIVDFMKNNLAETVDVQEVMTEGELSELANAIENYRNEYRRAKNFLKDEYNKQIENSKTSSFDLSKNNQEAKLSTNGMQESNTVSSKVEEYLKKTGLSSKMSVEEFINKAKQFTLEEEANMTEKQKELYSLISEIQNEDNIKTEKNIDLKEQLNKKESEENKLLPIVQKEKKPLIPLIKENIEKNKITEKQNSEKTKMETKLPKQKIEKTSNIDDFGEKIGGARKDLSTQRSSKPTKEVIHNYTVRQTEDGFSVDFKGKELKTGFKTQGEAEQYILDFKEATKNNLAFVREGINGDGEAVYTIAIRNPRTLKSQSIMKQFKSKQEAESYALALSIYLKEHGKNLYRPQIQKVERINPNNKNATKATGDNILKNFGFRGGEFGNWVKQNERQQFLNYAEDALNDLAEALGVTTDSLGQKNTMAIAFGARGKGLISAVAHFEPVKKVINMTRLHGAGSFAHEYGHSIDNFLSREGGYDPDGMVTTNYRNPKLSENMRNAIDEVINAMDYNISENQEEVDKKNSLFEKNRVSSLDTHLSYMDKVFRGEATEYKYNRKTKQYETPKIEVSQEQKNKYKKIRKILEEGKLDGKREFISESVRGKVDYEYAKPLEDLRALYKEIIGRKMNEDTLYWLYRYGQPAKQVTSVKSQSAFFKSARELDEMTGRASPYFSRRDEMWARAFESYVYDKLKAKGIEDNYLVHSVNNDRYSLFNPYPAGEERQNINKAFDNLIQTMKNEGMFTSNEENATMVKEEYDQLTIDGFNKEPENNLSKENWGKYQESKKKTDSIIKRDGTRIEVEKRKFSKDFIDNGYIDLNGKTIENASEVADMAQIFRNPKYETFRVIYMQGNTIVGQEAVSSKTPSSTNTFVGNSQAKGFYKIKNRMKRLNADGYYLIHNHPTGVAKASTADIKVTNTIYNKINGFLGHVIINSGTYALIEKASDTQFRVTNEIKIENYKPDKIDKMLSKELWANTQIKGTEDILHLAYDLKNNPNYSSLVLADARLKPRIVLDIPNSFLNMTTKQIDGYIRNVARQNGANEAFIATQNADIYEKMEKSEVLRDNVLYSVDEEGNLHGKNSKTKESRSGGIFESYTPTTLRANEKIEDIYNSFFGEEENQKQETKLPMKEKQEVKLPMKQENTKVKFDNEIMKTNSEIKGNSETSEKVAKILSEPTKQTKPEQRTWAILKANFIDKGAVFEKISQKTKNRELQGKYDYTLTSGARGQYAIGNDRYVYSNGKKTLQSKALTSIIDEVGENTQAFNEYMYHQLNVDRMTLDERFGIENKPVFGESVTADTSRAEIAKIEEQHPEFKKYAEDVYKYLDANKQELVDRGVISQETSDMFKERYPHYVPIQRANRKGNSIDVPLDTGRTGINSPIKKAKGGNQDINPLFQTIASQTLQTYRASARNNFGLELMNTLDQMNQLNQKTDIADIDSIVDTMTNEEQNNELLQAGKKGENPTFTVFENGKKITYEISQDMYDALKPKSELLNKLDNTKLAKIGRKISNFRRGVLTEYNPIFSITNALKDAQDVLAYSQHTAKTYAKIPESYAQIIKKGYWYNEYIQNGGEQNSYFTEGDFENLKKTKLDKAKNVLTFPLQKISQVNNVIEMAPRLAEYIVSRENGASIETAMLDAARVTTNFKAGGDITKFANRNGATFLNASVQGARQVVRTFQEANMKGLKGWTALALKYTIAGLPALLLNNLFWDDDDDYEQLQDYVKDNYYVIAKLPNGNFLRIPKGRMTATIQKVVSNANDFVKDGVINTDKVASTIWNDLKEDVQFGANNLAPNNPIENNILSPIFQVAKNKTWYGDDLVPQRLQDVPAEEQADESTDKFSKWLGEKLGKSPKKINYLLDQYLGGVGDVVLPMLTPQAENNVIEDKFTTDPVMKSQYPSDFFTKADELKVKNNSLKATDEDKLKYKYFSSIQSEVSSLYKQKREIQLSEKDDTTKKKELKEVQKQINKLAKEGLENVDSLKISGNSATIGNQQYYKEKDTWKKLTEKEQEKLKDTSVSTYSSYKQAINDLKAKKVASGELEEDKDLSDKDKIQLLKDGNYTKKEKSNLYQKTITNDKYYPTLQKSGIDIEEYIDYKLAQSNGVFTADKKNGKTVYGSGKAKVINYLNKNITGAGNRLLIEGKQYSLSNTKKKSLIEYVNKTFSSKEERIEVYKQLTQNFVVENGNVYMKVSK